MQKGLEFEKRVGHQMRLDHFSVESSRKLDHQKRDYVVNRKNASTLPFPVDIQFTIRFYDFLKLLNFIKRQAAHPRRKRLYVRVNHPTGLPLEKMSPRIVPVAQAIEKAIMSVQQRPEGIFILSIKEDNQSELLSLTDFVSRLKETHQTKSDLEITAQITTKMSESRPEQHRRQCEIIGKIDLSFRHIRTAKKIMGEIVELMADGFSIRGKNGMLYWATYNSFIARQRDFAGLLQRIFASGNTTRLRRKIKLVLFQPTEELTDKKLPRAILLEKYIE